MRTISGDSVAAIGAIPPEQGRSLIDASGHTVCPGFIDIHTHSDGDIFVHPTADSRVRQGVTTEVTGNCGSSAAPLIGAGAEERRKEYLKDDLSAEWGDVASYCVFWEKVGCSLNHALLLGQGTLRANAIGAVNRPLASDERAAVLRAVEEGMDQGAFGLSTGLQYTPGRFTPREEIAAMARVVARYGGFYASHMRSEDETLLEAIGETIAIGREAQLRVEISHLKAAGQVNWHKQRAALDLIPDRDPIRARQWGARGREGEPHGEQARQAPAPGLNSRFASASCWAEDRRRRRKPGRDDPPSAGGAEVLSAAGGRAILAP